MLINRLESFGETVNIYKLSNLLTVIVNPQPNRLNYYASFTTKYGSFDRTLNGEVLPYGVAHFLEHKMFEEKDGDAFNKLTELGVESNAFTTYNMTSYYIKCSNNFYEGLEKLINFVQELYVTKESVDSEKDIIEQEINMYEDNPDYKIYIEMLNNLYHNHPLKIGVAGTVDSIKDINKDVLKKCHEHFYDPNNMILYINGPVDEDELITFIKKNQSKKVFKNEKVEDRIIELEDCSVNKKQSTIKMEVSTPKVLIGMKICNYLKGRELLKFETAFEILLDIVIGESSVNKEKLREQKIVDDSFDDEFNLSSTYGFLMLSGDTEKPDLFINEMNNIISSVKNTVISERDFIRNKNAMIGQFIKSVGVPNFIASQFTKYYVNDINFFDAIEVLESIDIDYINSIKKYFNIKNTTIVKILPKNNT